MTGTSLETLQNQLDKVNAAISGTLDRNAADYDIGGRQLSSLDLDQLECMRRNLERRIAQKSGNRRPLVGEFGRD